ncbi:MAG: alpha/beta hydrolase [Deinococcales bacterium]
MPYLKVPYLNVNEIEEIEKIKLYYQFEGHRDNPLVVFLNGLTMDTSAWQLLSQALGADYCYLKYDCRGQGQSDKPLDDLYRPEEHSQDFINLLEGLEIQACHLVGLSNGGLVAALSAAALEELGVKILSLTMIDSFISVDTMLKSILNSWQQATLLGGSQLRFDVALPWVWGYAFIQENYDSLLSFRERASQANARVVLNLIEGLASFADKTLAKKALRAYRGPCLVLVGKDDLLTPLRYSHEIVEWAKHGLLVTLDRAGHAAPIEVPLAVARLLQGFWARQGEFLPEDGPADGLNDHLDNLADELDDDR